MQSKKKLGLELGSTLSVLALPKRVLYIVRAHCRIDSTSGPSDKESASSKFGQPGEVGPTGNIRGVNLKGAEIVKVVLSCREPCMTQLREKKREEVVLACEGRCTAQLRDKTEQGGW